MHGIIDAKVINNTLNITFVDFFESSLGWFSLTFILILNEVLGFVKQYAYTCRDQLRVHQNSLIVDSVCLAC